MRNGLPDDNESVVARGHRRRRLAIAGVAGLAVLGAGAVLVTTQLADDRETAPPAVSQAKTAQSPAPTPAAATTSASPPASASPSASASKSADAKAVAKEIAAARAAAAKDGVKLKRPLTQEGDAAAAAQAKVVNTGSLREDRATMRIVSARGDLTGQRELALVADQGTPVGDALCSQTIRVSKGAKPETKPNVLFCWRVSEQKSVFTVAVDLDGDPSEENSVAAINKEWQALG